MNFEVVLFLSKAIAMSFLNRLIRRKEIKYFVYRFFE